MKLLLLPKDNINSILLRDVETYCVEDTSLLVIFKDGRARNYPMCNLRYWEGEVPAGNTRSKPPKSEA